MKFKTNILLSAMAVAFSSSVVAVEPEPYITDSGIAIVPILNAGYKYDDNIFNESSDATGASIFTVAPAARFLLDDGINSFQVDVGVESGTFINSADDNYLSGDLHFNSHLEPSSRSRFDIKLEANRYVEARGTGVTEGLGDSVEEPLSYNEQLAQLTYEYGNLTAKGRVAVMARYYNKNFTNFSEITQFRNFDASTIGGTFFYSTNASTDAFIELKTNAIKYDAIEGISRDSDVITALVGVKWEATALTTGSFKIGHEQKRFEEAGRENFSGLSWEANVEWQPLTYSTFTLETSRKAKDPGAQGDYISESIYRVNWGHIWSEQISTTLNLSHIREEYTGFERFDKSKNVYLAVNYKFKRWADVSLYVANVNQDSNNDNIVYDKNTVGLNFTFSL